MVLFPIALIWIICVLVWLIRNSLNEPDVPGEEREQRRWWPRPPRRPNGRRPSGSRSGDKRAATRSRD
jgi:hypothetical protein